MLLSKFTRWKLSFNFVRISTPKTSYTFCHEFWGQKIFYTILALRISIRVCLTGAHPIACICLYRLVTTNPYTGQIRREKFICWTARNIALHWLIVTAIERTVKNDTVDMICFHCSWTIVWPWRSSRIVYPIPPNVISTYSFTSWTQ